jgi:hypothetical protein
LIPIQASRPVAIRVLSDDRSEQTAGRVISSSSQRIVVETTLSAGMNSAIELYCDGILLLGEVVDEKLSGDGSYLITAEVLHLLAVDSVAEHSRFWS